MCLKQNNVLPIFLQINANDMLGFVLVKIRSYGSIRGDERDNVYWKPSL